MIIPAIDLIGGKVVRLYQGDYSRKTEYDADPQERFDLYVSEAQNSCTSWILTEPRIHQRDSLTLSQN